MLREVRLPLLAIYGVALLFDRTRSYGRDLRICNYPQCGKFFAVIRPPKGRPQDVFCSKKCRLLERSRTAPDRARWSRMKKARKPK